MGTRPRRLPCSLRLSWVVGFERTFCFAFLLSALPIAAFASNILIEREQSCACATVIYIIFTRTETQTHVNGSELAIIFSIFMP